MAPLTLHCLPLFPLGTVLFPGGVLPLRVFEVRYLDMVGKCHRSGAPFGVVALAEGHEVRVAGAVVDC
jgi:Lon protease-like protein